mmetsp:Transcript_10132/g.30353  ORF Transcript_10132/g.30353 Transcript_10132/m.30353 type:complete len:836 (-) Transcript_10132:2926-5433(-)
MMSRACSHHRLSSLHLPDLVKEDDYLESVLGSPDKGHQLAASNPLRCPSLPISLLAGRLPTIQAAQRANSGAWHLGAIQQSRWRAWRLVKWWRCRPNSTTLCKFLAGITLALVLFHAASCGFFFCYRMPGDFLPSVSLHRELETMYKVRSGSPHILAAANSAYDRAYSAAVDDQPPLIPKIIHQTYKSANVPERVKPYMLSWKRFNPGWDIRFYDDAACIEFVSREFPEYLEAYKALPKHVERSDFFRYMVVLRLGGVYADLDTECRRPMSELILPKDSLIGGWENEFARPQDAEARHYVRNRQVLQWVFAGAPNHPALRELCDHINEHATHRFSNNTNRDTLERTGPGVWTDKVLKHAIANPPSKGTAWAVRLIAKMHWGAHPNGLDNLLPGDERIGVMHHYLGTWKIKGGWRKRRLSWHNVWRFLRRRVFHLGDSKADEQPQQGVDVVPPDQWQLYPTSVEWQPAFSMMVPLKGAGDPQAGDDVAATITAWGTWQPGLEPHRSPSPSEVLVAALGGARADQQVLLDIGAGLGLFTLSAAARGHRVIALEASPPSGEALQASLAFNGWNKLVSVHRLPAGAVDGHPVCLEREGRHDPELASGYSSAEAGEPAAGGRCTRTGSRRAAAALVPPGTDVVAVRISAPGWEDAVLDGLQPMMEASPPNLVMVEAYPARMKRGGGGSLPGLLKRMAAWGFTDISHAGAHCDERWAALTKKTRSKADLGLAAREALKQPTWCLLHPDGWKTLAARAPKDKPEVLLFTRKRVQPLPAARAAAAAGAAQSAATSTAQKAHLRGSSGGRQAGMTAGAPDNEGSSAASRGGRSPGLTITSAVSQ